MHLRGRTLELIEFQFDSFDGSLRKLELCRNCKNICDIEGVRGGLTSILVDSASLINLSKSSFLKACSTTAGRGVAGTGVVLTGCAILLTLGDARFGDIPFPTGLDKGEFLSEGFLP